MATAAQSVAPMVLEAAANARVGALVTYNLRDFIPAVDSETVARSRRAGLVIFGKTNTPEFAISPTTEPRLFGPTLPQPCDPPSGSVSIVDSWPRPAPPSVNSPRFVSL